MHTKPIILVLTGAWHVPKHYAATTNRLRHLGYTVECPLLQTNNNEKPPTKTLDDDVAQIRTLALSYLDDGRDIVALMHSYGGMVGTNAFGDLGPEDRKDKGCVRSLIYMTAFVPFEKESLAAIFGGGLPPFLTPTSEGIIHIDDPGHHFYHDLATEQQEKWIGELVEHPTVAQFEPLNSSSPTAAWRKIPVTYLFCCADQGLILKLQEMMVDRIESADSNVKVQRELCDASHSPFLSMPQRVVEVVVNVCEGIIA